MKKVGGLGRKGKGVLKGNANCLAKTVKKLAKV